MEETISSTSETSIGSSSDDDRKCSKKAKTSDTDVEGDDKISRLPDAILCNILASFSTKESVRTSILSKRWRYVWTSVPILVLNDSEFLHHKIRKTVDIKNCFVNFINRVLHLHNVSCIEKLHLFFCCDYELSSVRAWIDAAIQRNVKEIDMCVSLDKEEYVELSPSFFTSKKLMVLNLNPSFYLNVPTLVDFPNLKILHLNRVKFADDDSLKNFLSGCPVLEEFELIKCDDDNVRTLCIKSSTLKKLIVKLDHHSRRDFEYELVIESPNLQYLDLTNFVTEDYSVDFLSSLVEVYLSVTGCQLLSKDYNTNRYIKLLQSISNTKYLEISWVEMDLSTFPDFGNLPVFLNLTCLKLLVSDDTWDVLPSMLNLSPNVRICLIDKLVDYHSPCECQWKSPSCIPKCLLLCLEEIVIAEFEACNNEIEMVEYLLKNGRVLKKMLIKSVKLHPKEKSNVRKKLLSFPKASSSCKISFS